MKPKFILILSMLCTLAVAPVFGQTTYTWIGKNSGGDGTNLATAANYTTNEPGDIPAITLPNGVVGDTMQWDNQSGNGIVQCTYNNGLPISGFGSLGLNFVITANQTADVQIAPVGGAGANFSIDNVTISSPVASLRLGDDTGNANTLNFVLRPGNASQVHDWVNDSANPAYIYPNVRWQDGGGVLHILQIDGTGNWLITNNLAFADGAIQIQKKGTGTMYWNGPSDANAAPNSPINSPLSIFAGTVVLQFNNTLITPDAIVNEGYLEFNAPGQAMTLNGVISGMGTNEVVAGTLTLTGNNNYGSTTYIASTGILQIGAGGASGSPGLGNIDDDGMLVYDRTDSVTLTNTIYEDTGFAGSVVQDGSGTLTLTGNNSYTGATVVSNGTLIVSGQSSPNGVSEAGDLDVSGGTLISGGAGMVSSNSVAGNLNIDSGTLAVTLNKSLTQSSNTYYVATGTVNNYSTAGTPAVLAVNNAGPAVKAGDTFAIFNQPVQNIGGAAAVTVAGLGVTWQNNLAMNGTIKALSAQTTSLAFSLISASGTTLTFSATNGIPDAQYILLGSTNLASGAWTPILTNTFDGSGSISLSTNVLNTNILYEFFQLTQP